MPTSDKNQYRDDIYLVPEIIKLSKTHRTERYQESENAINWLRSDPKGYIQDAKELNEANEYFRKTAKFAKSWKYSCEKKDDIFPLKSFHLELIVTDLYKKNLPLGCLDGICNFFDQIDDYLNSPHFPDKADATKFVDDYINDFNENEWSAVKNAIIHAKVIIAQIKNATDHDEIERLLVGLVNAKPESAASTAGDRQTRVVSAYSRPYFE